MTGSAGSLTEAPQVQQDSTPSTGPGRNEDGERRICRRIDNTQSRMNRRQVCLTAREWRERQ